jgi:hypothetical protein
VNVKEKAMNVKRLREFLQNTQVIILEVLALILLLIAAVAAVKDKWEREFPKRQSPPTESQPMMSPTPSPLPIAQATERARRPKDQKRQHKGPRKEAAKKQLRNCQIVR